MGVPGFFVSLYSKYANNEFVFSKLNLNDENINSSFNDINSINELYLDTNCLIHPVCFKVYYENQSLLITNPQKLEEKMIKEIIIYIEKIINYIKPDCLVYIGIDGVAPMAKIKHQRIRRFKSIADNEIKENVAKKHNVEFIKPWNNSAITPGTEFMDKLTNAIISYLNLKKENNKLNDAKVKYIFSSANTTGEGEHKILQYIKEHIDEKKIRIIYGLDADLLYLALASEASKMYLLREVTEFQKMKSDDDFCFVSIDSMRECIYQDMIYSFEDLDNLENYKNNFIQDYIFMGFLLGNDFLPCLPSVNLSTFKKNLSGLEILFKCYQETFNDINETNESNNYEFLIQTKPKIKISYNFIKTLFKYLSYEEETYFRTKYKIRKYIPPCASNNAYDLEIHSIENLMFKIPDLFELGKENVKIEDSKEKYYKHYFHENNISHIISDYFKTLYWTSYYYFDKCPDYKYYFKHHKLPFVSDIYKWILESETELNYMENIYPKQNDYCKLINPLQQLFMVLPIQSAFLLPSEYKKVMINLPEYFPKNISQDFQLINKYWQATPEIKFLEPFFTWNKIKHIKLT